MHHTKESAGTHMLEQVLALANEYDMLPGGGHILCAVSGGADSMCLLHLLASGAGAGGFTVTAAHYNHHLRGAESDRDAAFVEKWCRDHGVPCHLGGGDVAGAAEARGLGIEETARELRYAFLSEMAEEVGADRIATAHNADDNAETLLLHLVRGTGLRGLTGIPPRRGNLVRPLLAISRAEIECYLTGHSVAHVEDSTNSDTAFARNRLRREVMPILRDLNPRLLESLTATVRTLRADNDYLTAQAAKAAQAARWARDDLVIRAELVAQEPDPVAVRMVQWMFGQMGERQFSAAHLTSVVDLARGRDPSAVVFLPHGLLAQRIYEELLLTSGSDPLPPFAAVPASLEGPVPLPGTGWRVTLRRTVCPETHPNTPNHAFFAPTELGDDLLFRPRQTGDEITLPRRRTKSLKKLLIDAKVPRRDRERIPLLADGAGVLWVAGFGPDHRRLASPGEEAVELTAERLGSGEAVLSPQDRTKKLLNRKLRLQFAE